MAFDLNPQDDDFDLVRAQMEAVKARKVAEQELAALRTQVAGLERDSISGLMETIKADNEKWWVNLETGEPIDRNVGEVLCLIHSEISEALEGHRKDLMDDHIPTRKMFVVELADAVIRILDAAAHWCPELPEVLQEKLQYNRHREDHKIEARRRANGKKY